MKCNANVGSMLEHVYETQKNQVALITGIRTTDIWIAGPLLYQLILNVLILELKLLSY
jgi:hypothetical protein